MNTVYESIIAGLTEAVDDAESEGKRINEKCCFHRSYNRRWSRANKKTQL